MGESLLVRKAGGGAKIDELIQEYTVEVGETITAGTFVDFVNNYQYKNYTTINQVTVFESNLANQKATKLTENKILIVFATSGQGTARIVEINADKTFTVGTAFNFSNDNISNINCVAFKRTPNETQARVMVVWRASNLSGSPGRATVLNINNINNNTISSQTTVQNTSSNYSIELPKLIAIDNKRILLVHIASQISGNRAAAVIAFYDPNTGSSIVYSNYVFDMSASQSGFYNSIVELSPYRFLFIWDNGSITNGKIITIGTHTNSSSNIINSLSATNLVLNDTTNLHEMQLIALSPDRAILTYRDRATIRGVFLELLIKGDQIIPRNQTFYTSTAIVQGQRVHNITKINEFEFAISYRLTSNAFSEIILVKAGAINWGSFSTFSVSSPFNYSPTGALNPANGSMLLVGNDLVFSSWESINSTPAIRTYIGENFKKIINTTAQKVFGLAKTGGTAGDTIEVFVNE